MLHEIDSSLDYHKLMFSHPSHAWRMQRVTKTLLLIFVLIHGWPSCLQYLHQGNWAWAAPCSKLRWSVGHQMVTAVWLWILDRWMYTRNTYYEKMSLIIWQTKYFCTKSQFWIKIKAAFFAKMTKLERIIVFHLSVKNLVPQNVIKMSSLTNESTLKMLFVISHQGLGSGSNSTLGEDYRKMQRKSQWISLQFNAKMPRIWQKFTFLGGMICLHL